MRLQDTTIILLICLIYESHAFWWYFAKQAGSSGTTANAETSNSLEKTFAPFEVTADEEKFLSEANDYLGKLPKLDQCHVLVINRLKQSCSTMSEEDLAKLSVNLLNCQSISEGRNVYKCTPEMTLTECTTDMDSDTWNAYHIVSNRARAVCYNFRQTQFRMKTEMTVNKLAKSAVGNLDVLEKLLNGQDKLKDVTQATTRLIQEGQKNVFENNKKLQKEQSTLKVSILHNIKRLNSEKILMNSRKKQVEDFSRLVNSQLDSLLKEFHNQSRLTKKGDKEILENLETVKRKSQAVLEKLESTLDKMDRKYATIEQKHSDTMKSMDEIQTTIDFMNNVVKKLEGNIEKQINWLNYFVGGTEDKLTVIVTLLGHSLVFFVAVLTVLFIGGSTLTKLVLIILFPMNALMAARGEKHFKFEELSTVVLFTYPVSWLFAFLVRWWSTGNKAQEKTQMPPPLYLGHDSSPFRRQIKREPESDEEQVGQSSHFAPGGEQETSLFKAELKRMCPQLITRPNDGVHSAPSTPRGRRQLNWSSTPKKEGLNDSCSSLPSSPSSEKNRPRCTALTMKGELCRKSALNGIEFCALHSRKSPIPRTNSNLLTSLGKDAILGKLDFQ